MDDLISRNEALQAVGVNTWAGARISKLPSVNARCPQCGKILSANVMPDNTYECDPEKNTECTKEGCFINGGPCHMTVYEEFKKERTE